MSNIQGTTSTPELGFSDYQNMFEKADDKSISTKEFKKIVGTATIDISDTGNIEDLADSLGIEDIDNLIEILLSIDASDENKNDDIVKTRDLFDHLNTSDGGKMEWEE